MKKTILLTLLALGAAGASAADAGSARMNYMLHCSGCHGLDGAGSPEAGVPTMRGALGHFLQLPEGREFLVKVPGTSQSALNNSQVAELLNWILQNFSRQEIPVGAEPYTVREVTAARAQALDDVSGRRGEIVKRLQEKGFRID